MSTVDLLADIVVTRHQRRVALIQAVLTAAVGNDTYLDFDEGARRSCGCPRYTYERYPIESLPPLDEAFFVGDFA